MTSQDLEQYRNAVDRDTPSLGQNEWLVACKTVAESNPAEGANLEQLLKGAIQAHRKPESGLTSTYLPAESWQKLFDDSEERATRELLGDLLDDADELDKQAQALAAKAAAKHRQVEADAAEFRNIGTRIERVQARIETVQAQRAALDKSALRQQLRDAYAAWLFCDDMALANGYQINLNQLQSLLCSADLRLEVLSQADSDCQADLAELIKRQKELAKLLKR